MERDKEPKIRLSEKFHWFCFTQMYVVTQVENFGDSNGIGKKKKKAPSHQFHK